jgi:hypothetical protein
MRDYKYPDDISRPLNKEKLNEFKQTLAFAVAFNESIIYEENDIGYHIYAADVLATDDDDFLILEFNGYAIGYDCVKGIKNTPECEPYKKRFSKDYFSFILNSTVFPVFGFHWICNQSRPRHIRHRTHVFCPLQWPWPCLQPRIAQHHVYELNSFLKIPRIQKEPWLFFRIGTFC